MKLEYLVDIIDEREFSSADPKRLLRMYDFDDFELMKIRHLIKRSLIDREGQLIISNLDFVQASNCTLTLLVSQQDSGVIFSPNDENNFLGLFCRNTYIHMLDIIDNLKEGYNRLYYPQGDDEIDLLLSPG